MKEGGWKGRSEEARERGWKSGSEGDGEVARAGERVGEWEQEEEGPGGILRFVGASTCIQCPVGTYTNTSGENVHILPRFFYIFLRRPELRT